jgi:ribosome-binding factor A
MKIRPERVAQLMRREIAGILETEMRDPRLSTMVSVTDVEVARDLSFARVYVSVLVEGGERVRVLSALQDARSGFVRHELDRASGCAGAGSRFVFDDSLERARGWMRSCARSSRANRSGTTGTQGVSLVLPRRGEDRGGGGRGPRTRRRLHRRATVLAIDKPVG